VTKLSDIDLEVEKEAICYLKNITNKKELDRKVHITFTTEV